MAGPQLQLLSPGLQGQQLTSRFSLPLGKPSKQRLQAAQQGPVPLKQGLHSPLVHEKPM
jgi:hypothetical protein